MKLTGKPKNEVVWMPHAGHFIDADNCRFRMNTYARGYIISTIGEWETGSKLFLERLLGPGRYAQIGHGRLYETMVFHAVPSDSGCCSHEADVTGGELHCEGANDAATARTNHMRILELVLSGFVFGDGDRAS